VKPGFYMIRIRGLKGEESSVSPLGGGSVRAPQGMQTVPVGGTVEVSREEQITLWMPLPQRFSIGGTPCGNVLVL
jgi:hypothetical protein